MACEITKEQIDEVKKVHKSVYLGNLSWEDEEGSSHSLQILYRKPTVSDIEVFAKTTASEPIVANRNLFISVMLAPAWEEVAPFLEEKSTVINVFIEKELIPFFGANIRTTSRKM